MEKAVTNFIKALKEIEKSHYLTQRTVLVDQEINIFGEKFTTYENNFVTKLNEKYALLSDRKTIEEPINLIRQCQIPKKFAYSNISDSSIQKSVHEICIILGEEADSICELNLIPDFIIHKDEFDTNQKNQLLIAEVKTEFNLSYKKFLWDFFKLIIYLNKFNFQSGIFLCINTPKNTIYDYIQEYFDSELYLPYSYRRLYVIIQESFESKIEVITLQDFYDKWKV